MAVLGVDASTRSTGIALPTGRTMVLSPPDGIGPRLHWWAGMLDRVLRLYEPRLIVAEAVATHTYAVAAHALAQMVGVLHLAAYERSVAVVEVNPMRLKRYATGRGNATKDDMVATARAAGAEVAGHDQADAWLLRALGVAGMGGPDLLAPLGADPGHRLEVVAQHTWPVLR